MIRFIEMIPISLLRLTGFSNLTPSPPPLCCLNLKNRNMARLTIEERHAAIAFLRAGRSYRDIARHLGCHNSTISRLQQRLRATGRLADRPRPGQPRVTTVRDDRMIVATHTNNR